MLRYLLLSAALALVATTLVYIAAALTAGRLGSASFTVDTGPGGFSVASLTPSGDVAVVYLSSTPLSPPRPPAGFDVNYYAKVRHAPSIVDCELIPLSRRDVELLAVEARKIVERHGVVLNAYSVTLWTPQGPLQIDGFDGFADWSGVRLVVSSAEKRALTVIPCRRTASFNPYRYNQLMLVYLVINGSTRVNMDVQVRRSGDTTYIGLVFTGSAKPIREVFEELRETVEEFRREGVKVEGHISIGELLEALAMHTYVTITKTVTVAQPTAGNTSTVVTTVAQVAVVGRPQPLLELEVWYTLKPSPSQVLRVAGGFLLGVAFIAYDRRRHPETYRAPRIVARLLRRGRR